ncbi:MAG: F0F1 ATP synthase subunit delta, partial [Chromatiaceae bacterium]
MAGDITTIARPYAEAAFALAQESGAIPAWSDALNLLGALAGDPAMAAQITNPE